MSPSKVSNISFDTFSNTVDGKPRGAKTHHQGIDPATGEKLWDVPIATKQDVDDAVASAEKAFKSWSQESLEKRKEYLQKYCDLYMSYNEEFIDLLCKEAGKPVCYFNQVSSVYTDPFQRQFAALEVKSIAFFFAHHMNLEIPSERIEDDDKVLTTRYMPLGVVGAICPWNFPLILSFGKIIPAVLTGCTIIVKPSPFTPYTALKTIELAQQIFPPGVIQVLGGDDKLGPMLTAHPGIAKISFTGSIATGKKIMEACSKTLKRVTLELGGNDASIVLPDVDIEKVAPELVMGAFQNSGQVCLSCSTLPTLSLSWRPGITSTIVPAYSTAMNRATVSTELHADMYSPFRSV